MADTVIHDTTGGLAVGVRLPQDAVSAAYAHLLAALYEQSGGRRGLPLPVNSISEVRKCQAT